MSNQLRIKVVLTPAAKADIQRMNEAALRAPGSQDEALLEATIVMLSRLNGRRHPTKPLDFESHMADLSDCDSTYVGADPYDKPPIRIVSRDLRPTHPGTITRREIVAIGPRRDSQAYKMAAQRLDRPVGVSLDQLRQMARNAQPSHDYSATAMHTQQPKSATQLQGLEIG